jgi:hypothetical protein
VPARRRLRGWIALLATLAIAGTIAWWAQRTPLPDRAAFESKAASQVGSRERAAVTAVCEEPHEDGWGCLLRDDAGRYGWLSASVTRKPREDKFDSAWSTFWTWGFEVDAAGRYDKVLDPPQPIRDESLLLGAALQALRAVGTVDIVAFDCPDLPARGTVTCAGQHPIPEATITDAGDGRRHVRFTVPLPP